MRIASFLALAIVASALGCRNAADRSSEDTDSSNDATVTSTDDSSGDLTDNAAASDDVIQPADDDLLVEEGESSDSATDDLADDAGLPSSEHLEKMQELQAQLQAAMRGRDLKEGREILLKLRELDGSNPQFTFMQAQISSGLAEESDDAQEAGKLLAESGELMREVMESGVIPEAQKEEFAQQVYWVEARSKAALGNDDDAAESVKKLLDTGFLQLELFEGDKYLAAVVKRPELEQLLDQAREKMIAAMRDEARQEIADQSSYEFDFSLPNLDGDTVSKSDYNGKLLIVDIWGTWCPPCKAEIPHFLKLREKYSDKLDVVGINYERAEGEAAIEGIRSFVESEGVTYTCVVGDQETKEQVPDFKGFPTTLFLDSEGNVRLQLVGYHPFEKLEAIVLELLKEQA